MTYDERRDFCLSLPGTTEDVKWENDFCFSVGGKMFAACGLGSEGIGFKCSEERFHVLIEREGIRPAPYLARAHWVSVEDASCVADDEMREWLREAHAIVRSKLPKRVQATLPPM